MTALVVESVGAGASVQDQGRNGWRRHGVAAAGAMDRLAAAVANRLVGNPATAAIIESLFGGARFRVVGGPLLVAVHGGGAALIADGVPVPPGRSALAAETVAIGPVRGGVFACLAVAGGVTTAPEMGSRSMHLRSGLGGGRLGPGDRVPVGAAGGTPLALTPPEPARGPIRVMAGPQADWFPAEAMGALLGAAWRLDRRGDRMGRFLCGPRLAVRRGSMVSDGVVPGAVQVPPSGQPVVLMRDGQTTGGYPKLACVIGADLDRLAQMPPGAELRFALVTRAEAVAAAARFAAAIDGLRPGPAVLAPRTEMLLGANLISGVWG